MIMNNEVGQVNTSSIPIPETHCPFCGHRLTEHLASIVKHKVKYRYNGENIYLTYYDCPVCSNRKVVQIDDDYTYKLLKQIEIRFGTFMLIRNKGGNVSKQEQIKFDRIRRDLASSRSKLTKTCNGVELCDKSTGKQFIVSI